MESTNMKVGDKITMSRRAICTGYSTKENRTVYTIKTVEERTDYSGGKFLSVTFKETGCKTFKIEDGMVYSSGYKAKWEIV